MTRRVHFVGIAGAGLSAIARILQERGEKVSGSDQAQSDFSIALEEAGIEISYGHRAENIVGADVVIASSAIPDENIELESARNLSIPVLRRNEFLPELTQDYSTIAVAGTHGKTTTTGMIAWILQQAEKEPTFLVGGTMLDFGTNARSGAGKHFVIEADEYDRAFLGLFPSIAVVTNLEHDHPDCYPSLQEMTEAFQTFCHQVEDILIVCGDDPGSSALDAGNKQRITYGLEADNLWRAEELRPNMAGGMDFLVLHKEQVLGLARTRLPGEHNVLNSLAAIAVSDSLGVPFSLIRDALTEYHGTGRRFEVVGQVGEITIIDDYAHHPTAIAATLSGARARYPEAEIWAIYQPHTYSRIRALFDAFELAFENADHVLLTEIYAAREVSTGEISAQDLVERIKHPDVRYAGEIKGIAADLRSRLTPGAVVIILSAGDANQIGVQLVELLKHSWKGIDDA
jgi:UDP-N-acetylmuramate--alanine ligase